MKLLDHGMVAFCFQTTLNDLAGGIDRPIIKNSHFNLFLSYAHQLLDGG